MTWPSVTRLRVAAKGSALLTRVDGVTGPLRPSNQAALATALFKARVARLGWKAGGRPSH